MVASPSSASSLEREIVTTRVWGGTMEQLTAYLAAQQGAPR